MGHLHGVERFGEGADLVELHQDRVGGLFLNPAREPLDVGHEQIVADELHAFTQALREQGPARPIVFGQTVFDRDDRIAAAKPFIERDHFA